MPRRIDFLIIGAQKAGTTALWTAIGQHSQVAMARSKEVHFFDKRSPSGVAAIDHWLYNRAFDWRAKGHGKLLGEATPAYLWWPGALERIHTYHPDIKLIAMLRDPVERAWSQHWMDVALERKDKSIVASIDAEMARTGATPDRVHSLISRGLYAGQVKRLRDLFPTCQTLMLRYEDLQADWPDLSQQVCGFLGVADQPLDLHSANRTKNKPPLDQETRRWLASYFREDAAETRRLLGWERDDWSV